MSRFVSHPAVVAFPAAAAEAAAVAAPLAAGHLHLDALPAEPRAVQAPHRVLGVPVDKNGFSFHHFLGGKVNYFKAFV